MGSIDREPLVCCISPMHYIYRISPNKVSGTYAKHRKGAFILYSIYKAKSLSNFVFIEIFTPLPDDKI